MSARKGNGAAGSAAPSVNKKEQRRLAAETREKGKALRNHAQHAESALKKLTAEVSAVDQAMFDPTSAQPALAKLKMSDLMVKRAGIKEKIAEAEAAWMEACEALEAIDA